MSPSVLDVLLEELAAKESRELSTEMLDRILEYKKRAEENEL